MSFSDSLPALFPSLSDEIAAQPGGEELAQLVRKVEDSKPYELREIQDGWRRAAEDTEERERSRQPGYVCRYDDYDGDYDDYSQIVGEMQTTREGRETREGYRTHPAHPQPRRTHAADQGARAGRDKDERSFGSGIL